MELKNYECEGQMSLFDIATDCRTCRKFKIDCPQEAPTQGLCDRYKPQPKWERIDRCQNCSRWVHTGDQTKPISWGVEGVCMAHDQRTVSGSYCDSFEGMGDKEYWKEI